MNSDTQTPRDYRFAIGLLAGTVVGAGLMLWLAPRAASELRGRIADSTRKIRQRASSQYQDASARVGDAVDDLARKSQSVKHDVADAVARGAHEVERFATAAKHDRVAEAGPQPVPHRAI